MAWVSAGGLAFPTGRGVTVAEMDTNSTPMVSCTSVSKNARRAGTSAAPVDMPSSSAATTATNAQVIGTPR